jgi:hypothetical protein
MLIGMRMEHLELGYGLDPVETGLAFELSSGFSRKRAGAGPARSQFVAFRFAIASPH